MSDPFDETPVFETRKGSLEKKNNNLGYLLVGAGAFFLLVQFVPGSLFFPLLFMAAGAYFLRQDSAPLYFTGRGRKFTRGHAFLGIGLFLLISQVVPGSLLIPLMLIGIGYYLLKQRQRSAVL